MEIKRKAFTLIELLVVLMIFAVVMGLGIMGFSTMNKNSNVSEATGDLVSIIKETQNLAKNNTLPNSASAISAIERAQNIYYYVLVIDSDSTTPYGKATRYLFGKNNDFVLNAWDLVLNEGNIKSKLFNSIAYKPSVGNCKSIIFENLTGKLKASNIVIDTTAKMQSAFANANIKQCEFRVEVYNDAAFSKTVVINIDKGTYGIKGE